MPLYKRLISLLQTSINNNRLKKNRGNIWVLIKKIFICARVFICNKITLERVINVVMQLICNNKLKR